MAGLVPAIHVFLAQGEAKTWMPGKAGHDEQFAGPPMVSPFETVASQPPQGEGQRASSEMRTGAGTGSG